MEQRKLKEPKMKSNSVLKYQFNSQYKKIFPHQNDEESYKTPGLIKTYKMFPKSSGNTFANLMKNKTMTYYDSNNTNETNINNNENNENENFVPLNFTSNKFININSKLINDLNSQIDNLNKKRNEKQFNYKQTVNLQQLNDYILYEYTKNKMKEKQKSTTSFRLPLQYRRMGSHGKKDDLVPLKSKPTINLEDVLILHNTNLRRDMTKNKVQNYYLKNSLKATQNRIRMNREQIDCGNRNNAGLVLKSINLI